MGWTPLCKPNLALIFFVAARANILFALFLPFAVLE